MKLCLTLLFLAGFSATSFADHKPGMKMPEPTKEQRAKMADMHESMAKCLRSDKGMKDCHKEMKASCEKDKDGMCPMMHGHGHGGHGDGKPQDDKEGK